jgi:cation transport regulator
VGRDTFRRLVGDASAPDYAAFDRFLPHPVYARQLWISILNPTTETFDVLVKPLLREAHDRIAATRARHRTPAERPSAAMRSIAVVAVGRAERAPRRATLSRTPSIENGSRSMPYAKVSDLPEAQVDQYTEHQKHAFLKAFNNAFDEYDGDEGRAFATAHAAAQRAPEREPDEDPERD